MTPILSVLSMREVISNGTVDKLVKQAMEQ